MTPPTINVFTKPWKAADLETLAGYVRELGFFGVELAVRPGYQVEPTSVRTNLSQAAETFARNGLRIESVAAEPTKEVIEACGQANIPLLRTMLPVDPSIGYRASVDQFRRKGEELYQLLRNSGVRIGVQNHCDNFVGTAAGLMEALQPLPEEFVAVLDLAHTTLAGEPAAYALEIAEPRLAMVNLKNACFTSQGLNDHGEVRWQRRWVLAREGLTSWSSVVELLWKMDYSGPVCLTAEYSDDWGRPLMEEEVTPLIRADFAHLKKLISQTY